MSVRDLTGQRFGRLIVERLDGRLNRSAAWSCRCDCGATLRVRSQALLTSNTRSCGCLRRSQLEASRNNLAGRRFGRLTVIEQTGSSPPRWSCRCDCGVTIATRAGYLRSGDTSSCGCLRRETTGHAARGRARHGMTDTRAYQVWHGMINRCRRENDPRCAAYGGRGITVCERWQMFENFLADMGEPPLGLSIDRIDVNGHYEPSNCRWATPAQQARNKRNNVLTPEQPALIREMAKQGASKRDIARRFRISEWVVSDVVKFKTWWPESERPNTLRARRIGRSGSATPDDDEGRSS